jgi:hypothetical protein
MSHRRLVIIPALSLLVLAGPALAQNPVLASNANGIRSEVPEDEVAAITAATEKYKDVAVAEADVVSAMEGQPKQLGGMGYHYFRPDLLGITAEQPRVDGNGTHLDWTQPGILVYEPQQDGSLQLVAIENLVWAEAWKEAGHDGPPEFHGNQYYHMIDNPETEVDEAHGFQPHYELHWWIYRENPSGAFSPFNPVVGCQYAPVDAEAAAN